MNMKRYASIKTFFTLGAGLRETFGDNPRSGRVGSGTPSAQTKNSHREIKTINTPNPY
jgi:hypothetical protein